MTLVRVASVHDLKEGCSKVVVANGRSIALHNVGGKFFATSNDCPHKHGPLGEGYLDGKVITCPWHGWKFDVETGVSPVAPAVSVQTYKTVVKGDEIFVNI